MVGALGGTHVRTKQIMVAMAQHERYSFYFLFHLCLIISRGAKSAAHAKTTLHTHTEGNKGTARKVSPLLPYRDPFEKLQL